jgi:uncharacterized DUF497 family protein
MLTYWEGTTDAVAVRVGSSEGCVQLKKHGVDFETAARVFQDPLALTLLDETHQQQEERWATLGQVDNHKLVVVIHTWRKNDATIRVRIISARRATKREERQYQGDI